MLCPRMSRMLGMEPVDVLAPPKASEEEDGSIMGKLKHGCVVYELQVERNRSDFA